MRRIRSSESSEAIVAGLARAESDSGEVGSRPLSEALVASRLGALLGANRLICVSAVCGRAGKLLGGLGVMLVGQGGFEPPTT